MKGKFILVVGPSGSGKGTLISHIRPLFPEITYAKSATTRAMREGEARETSPYYFLSVDEFKTCVEKNDFLEWAEYGGNFYGTLKSEVVSNLEGGTAVLKEMEVQGARQILSALPRGALSIIFIDAGSWEDMQERIMKRAPMNPTELQKRKARYDDEMSFMREADFVVQNPMGKVEEAKQEFERVMRSILGIEH